MSEEKSSERIEKEIEKLREDIKELADMVKELKEERVQQSRPTGPRAEILKLLKERGERLSVKEIAESIGLAEATVSGYTLDLYKGGYLDRGKRLVKVSPTRRVRQLEYYISDRRKKRWHYAD